MAIVLDDDGLIFLLAALTKRAIVDVNDRSVSSACRAEAAEFLRENFPDWRARWHARPRSREDRRKNRAQP